MKVLALNGLNPALTAILAWIKAVLLIALIMDFRAVGVAANSVDGYGYSLVAPDVAGRYIVEVGLVPAQLSAYDAAWLVVS